MRNRLKGLYLVDKVPEDLWAEVRNTTYSVHFSGSVVSDSLRPHELQHARPPCPSPNYWTLLKLMSIELVTPSNHLPLCHPLLLLPSIFPSLRVFSNESVLELQLQHQPFLMNIQGWFPLGLIGLISLMSKGLSRVFSSATI